MSFDFSHLYKTETVTIDGLFDVVIREIPHGEMVDLQRQMFGEMKMSRNQRDIDRQIEAIRFDAPGFADNKNVMAIQSWTLQDASGNDVPVSLEAWQGLPHWITEQIEGVIDRLNPDMDEDFRDEPEDGRES